MNRKAETMKIYLIRSDQGDGGWSLHAHEQEDETGVAPVLLAGTATLVDDEWDRPTRADYERAAEKILD